MGGGSWRGPELIFLQYRNTSVRQRCAYLIAKMLCFMSDYHKAQSFCGARPSSMKGAPFDVTFWAIEYLALVTPVLERFAFVLALPQDVQERARTHLLWTVNGIPTPRQISSRLRSLLHRDLKIKLGLRDVRQLLKVLIRQAFSQHGVPGPTVDMDDSDEEGDDCGPLQAIVHSMHHHDSRTADKYYGITEDAFARVPGDYMSRAMFVICWWHNRFNMGLPPATTAVTAPVVPSVHNPSRDYVSFTLDDIRATVKSVVKAQVKESSGSAGKLHEMVMDVVHYSRRRPTSLGTALPATTADAATLRALRTMLKDPDATFRTFEQVQLFQEIALRSHHVLAIQPTGSGKSLACMLPYHLEGVKSLTIIIAPYVVLVGDYQRRMETLGISYCLWTHKDHSERLNHGINVLLVSLEAAVKERFRQLVNTKSKLKSLHARVFMDEIHLAVTQSDFRPKLRELCQVLQGYVQVVGLSGSLALRSIPALLDCLHLQPQEVVVVKETSTARPEHAYSIHDLYPDAESVLVAAQKIMGAATMGPEDRGIIFFKDIPTMEKFRDGSGNSRKVATYPFE